MTPTRIAGLDRMNDFAPRMGKRYASGRNYDNGPGKHAAVSTLSPWLRRRLITEQEVAQLARDAHGEEGAEKFLQEVLWRGYFKGWLEARPMIWDSYRAGLERDLWAIGDNPKLSRAIAAAEEGRTGIECFDAWAQELIQTGYLHNHARMWFASIWIFTLGLPWRIGADFFLRHLLDGDPASNTLSWRWVGGLHTRGKTYQAEAWNIAKFSQNRFTPTERELTAQVDDILHTEPGGLPDPLPLRGPSAPRHDLPSALLLTEEDCSPQDFNLSGLDIRITATLQTTHLRSLRPVATMVAQFDAGALADAASRVDASATKLRADDPRALADWAEASGATQIVTPFLPAGYVRDWVMQAKPLLDARGIILAEWQRDWDRLIWPHAKAGFFKVKQKMPQILHQALDGRQTQLPLS
jgi:deoxyribodipyrimidine photo-lyase